MLRANVTHLYNFLLQLHYFCAWQTFISVPLTVYYHRISSIICTVLTIITVLKVRVLIVHVKSMSALCGLRGILDLWFICWFWHCVYICLFTLCASPFIFFLQFFPCLFLWELEFGRCTHRKSSTSEPAGTSANRRRQVADVDVVKNRIRRWRGLRRRQGDGG